MNKYQEALEYLTEEARSNYFRKYVQTSKEKVFLFKSAKALQELVNKATPKKPYYWGDWYGDEYWKCPCCEKTYDVDYGKNNYCLNCGQAIDWSE